ncbi:hypothetical protein [Actinomadura sp. 9N215]|uniref:hypothetical protein n=1 Tax=Actinomadura sp. 9N215 TaxID=3375150 RepID=UPI0037942D70
MAAIGMVAAGLVLLGNGANAAPLPGASPGPEHSGGKTADRSVTVVNVYGDDNVIVTDRSVMAAGDGTRLNANAGDVSSSGTVGIDDKNSALTSGASTNGVRGAPSRYAPSGPVGARALEPAPATETRPVSETGTGSATAGRSPFPTPVSGDGQGTAISGYEDHSVGVSGEDQIAVYDDSNLFVNRNGQLNANTGDTDSSGLNAVDVSGSKVRSGDHTEDGENGDDDEDGGQVGTRPQQGTRSEGAPTGQPTGPTGQPTGPTGQATGPTGQAIAPTGTEGGSKGQSTGTVTDEGQSSATGKNAATIGADGYDNLGTDVHGKRNIAVYDDSNVVVGGTGKANAQIGDSDTSGAVVMDVHDSDVGSGNST